MVTSRAEGDGEGQPTCPKSCDRLRALPFPLQRGRTERVGTHRILTHHVLSMKSVKTRRRMRRGSDHQTRQARHLAEDKSCDDEDWERAEGDDTQCLHDKMDEAHGITGGYGTTMTYYTRTVRGSQSFLSSHRGAPHLRSLRKIDPDQHSLL